MTVDALQSDPLGRRIKSLELQNLLIKLAVVVLLTFLVWRTIASNSLNAPPEVTSAPAADPQLPGPTVNEVASVRQPEPSIVPAADELPAAEPAKEPAPEPVQMPAKLSDEQAYRAAQTLITRVSGDAKYATLFAEAWARQTGSAPTGNFSFPENFAGDLIAPTPTAGGRSSYELWGSGLKDPQRPNAPAVWYKALLSYDAATGEVRLESLLIAGRPVVRDWHPESEQELTTMVTAK